MNTKKYICILTAFILCLSFVACDTNTPEPISNNDNSTFSTATSFDGKFDEKSNDKIIDASSEAASAEVNSSDGQSDQSAESTTSEPFLSIDPEGFPYRLFKANNAKELVEEIVKLNAELNNDIQKLDPEKPDYFANLNKIIADGYVINPSVDGVYAETDTPNNKGNIEMLFNDDSSIVIMYYCKNDNNMWVKFQVEYPNSALQSLIDRYGIEGYQMHYGNIKKPISEYTVEDKATLSCEKLSLEKSDVGRGKYDVIKTTKRKRDSANDVTFLYEGKIISVSYKYRDEAKNPDDILKTISFDKVELN